MKTNDSLKILADIFGLDPKAKDLHKLILKRMHSENIPDSLKKSVMNVIVPTVSENKTMDFKQFRQVLNEKGSHDTSSMASTDTIQHGYGYQKVDPSTHYDPDGILDNEDIFGELEDEIEDLDIDDVIGLGAYEPDEIALIDDEGQVEDFGDIDLSQYDNEDQWKFDAEEMQESVNLDEALTLQGRIKLGRAMKQHASQLAKRRTLAMKRVSSPDKIMHRAHHLANAMFYKKMLRGKDPKTLTSAQKSRLEVLRQKNAAKIAKVVPRLIKVVKSIETKRLHSK